MTKYLYSICKNYAKVNFGSPSYFPTGSYNNAEITQEITILHSAQVVLMNSIPTPSRGRKDE